MNRVLSLILLVLVLFYSVGFYFVYQQNREAIKREMQGAIASKHFLPGQLVVISVPLSGNASGNGFEIYDEDEISWNGSMYDLVSIKKEAGSTKTYHRCFIYKLHCINWSMPIFYGIRNRKSYQTCWSTSTGFPSGSITIKLADPVVCSSASEENATSLLFRSC